MMELYWYHNIMEQTILQTPIVIIIIIKIISKSHLSFAHPFHHLMTRISCVQPQFLHDSYTRNAHSAM